MTAFALLLVFAAADEKIVPKMPLGKDTTVVDGPLTKDGYIDYGAALAERLGKGVTPQTNANANALLWTAMGPKPEGKPMSPGYFKALGIAEPPETGEYFVKQHEFEKDVLKDMTPEQREAHYVLETRIQKTPWSEKDHPQYFAYLKANEKPLAVAIEATKRKHYFNPLISTQKEGEPNMLVAALLPNVQRFREFASALSARAMLKLGEKKYDDAWQDLMAMLRLARLLSHGGTMIEYLVAVAIEQVANTATLTFLEHAPLTAAQFMDRWKEIAALPAMQPLAEKVNLAERFLYLDCMQMTRRGMMGLLIDNPKKLTDDELKALDSIDWAPLLRDGNAWYDKMVKAMSVKNQTERTKALTELDHQLRKRKAEWSNQTALAKAFTALDLTGKAQMKRAAEMIVGLVMPSILKVQEAADRRGQTAKHLKLAFALAAYKADAKAYPAKLADLVPTYIAALPVDGFSGKDLVYTRTEKGYTFYSVGPNGKDDGGRTRDDEPRGDDLKVTMPRASSGKP